jgi:predicted  nucleic acid-binding Zn-ribbon protein
MSQRAFLYNLQLFDNQMDVISDRISIIDKIINAKKEILESKKTLDEIISKIEIKKKEISEIETQSNKLVTKLKQNNDALYAGKIKNPKEMQSIEEENLSLKKRIQVYEESLFELMLINEENEQELKIDSERHENLLLMKEKEKSALLIEKQELIDSLEKLLIEKSPIEKQIKDELVQKYNQLRSKNRLAVTTVKENACTACGNTISPAEIQKIKSATDEYYCQICKRILYHG